MEVRLGREEKGLERTERERTWWTWSYTIGRRELAQF